MKKSLLIRSLLAVALARHFVQRPVDGHHCWHCGQLVDPLDAEHPARCAKERAAHPKEPS